MEHKMAMKIIWRSFEDDVLDFTLIAKDFCLCKGNLKGKKASAILPQVRKVFCLLEFRKKWDKTW